jgi:hypothetical protein
VGQGRETDLWCLGFQRRKKEAMDSSMFSFYQLIVKFMIVNILEFIVCYVNEALSFKFTLFPYTGKMRSRQAKRSKEDTKKAKEN